ncbi:hypothetical protein MBLNU457_7257t1 [Dothideomycetes sp. NU457]
MSTEELFPKLYEKPDRLFWEFQESGRPQDQLNDFLREENGGTSNERGELRNDILKKIKSFERTTNGRNADDTAQKDKVIDELKNIKPKPGTWYALEHNKFLTILPRAQSPITNYDRNGKITDTDALLLKPHGLAAILQLNVFYNGPVFIKDLADAPYTNLDDFMELELNDRKPIQVACGDRRRESTRPRNMQVSDFKTAIKDVNHKSFPFNSLDINCDVNTGLRLKEFENEECRFMPRLFSAHADDSSRRGLAPELWALIGNGALTLPHMDSHGYSTYLRVVEGQVGFLWLSHPDEETVDYWMENVIDNVDLEWKFRIVKKNEAVYFPAGTIHAVFRSRETGPTFILGGHILRWSTIDEWARVCALQTREKDSTNEETADIPDLVLSGAGFILDKAHLFREDKVRRFWEFAKQIHPDITPEMVSNKKMKKLKKLPASKKRKRDAEEDKEDED